MLVTRPFVVAGTRLWVNIDAARGDVIIEMIDSTGKVVARSQPVTGDVRRGAVSWSAGNLGDRRGAPCRLRFTARQASLYSYWFSQD